MTSSEEPLLFLAPMMTEAQADAKKPQIQNPGKMQHHVLYSTAMKPKQSNMDQGQRMQMFVLELCTLKEEKGKN